MSTPVATAVAGRRGLWRWAVALVATVMLVVSGSGLVVFAQSGAGESKGPQFVPAGASLYLEARLDMPAGQDEALAQMMTAFPGFADAGSFGLKMDEIFAGLGSQMGTELPPGFIGDVLTGEIAIAITDLESAMMTGDDPPVLIGLPIADTEMAQSMMASLTDGSDSGAEATEVMYRDVAIMSDGSTSAAVHADFLLLSPTVEAIQAAIDTLDGADSLADDPRFATAYARLPDARLAGMYIDLASFGSLIGLAGSMAGGQAGMELPVDDLVALLPMNMVGSLAAEPDRATLEFFVTPGEGTPMTVVGDSELAGLFPAETQLYVEIREMGSAIETGLTGLVDLLASQEGAMGGDSGMGEMGDIDMLFGEDSPITSMLGGVALPEFLDFVDDAALGSGWSSDGLWFGMAAEVSNEETADERITTLMTLLRFLEAANSAEGSSAGSSAPQISVDEALVDGTEIWVVTVPFDEMTAGSTMIPDLGDTVSVAVADGNLLIGTGDFVETALTESKAYSLGVSPGYVDALAGEIPNSGVLYADLGAILAGLDPMLSTMMPEWTDMVPTPPDSIA